MLRQEIQEDFKRLKSSVEHSEVSVIEANRLSKDYRHETVLLKEQLNRTKDAHMELEQEFNKLTIESYNMLYNIRHKFENNPKITKSLNMALTFDFTQAKSQSILELVALIGDITNILNYELKNCIIKESQFLDL